MNKDDLFTKIALIKIIEKRVMHHIFITLFFFVNPIVLLGLMALL
ncbi:hypothetical protein KP78_37840 [Jeotgalibacillus soli]|uniref:Uncharacterized protein n=1 Tax=Jeotgalibacillus soli TaxID=889306 RepID=A0A0C2R0Y0_9BACL|nr:hypothetical protein KP78_37840 [Jeotgalibacillus soli]